MSRFIPTLAALAGAAVIVLSTADAAPRRYACDAVSTWSVCQGAPVGGGRHHIVTPPRLKPAAAVDDIQIHPEGSASIAGGAGGGGGGGGGR